MKKEPFSRYPVEVKVDRNQENVQDAVRSYKHTITNNIKRAKQSGERPRNMEYFYNLLLNPDSRVGELQAFKHKGGKVIGVFCIQVPEELIYAAGAVPIRLDCGLHDAVSCGEQIVPKNTCPMIRSSVGYNFLGISPLFELCDLLIIPSTCDGKKKMADVLSNYHEVWVLDMPNDKDKQAAQDFWVAQVRELKTKLEEFTGNKIHKSHLRESIQLLRKRTTIARSFLELRKDKPISGRDAYMVMQAAFIDEVSRWMKQTYNLILELKGKDTAPKQPRILMTGSALTWPNMKLLHTIEEAGARIVTDDSCACGQYFYNPVELNDWSMKAMIEGVADKALLPAVCPVFVKADDRIDRVLELIEQYRIDGVVYHVLRLCQVFDFEYMKLAKVLESKKIPMIKIETELSEEDAGQIRTRIEAFIEMLEMRK